MSSQKETFINSEADEWFNRNADSCSSGKPEAHVPLKVMKEVELHPNRVLEIGCGNGVRLEQVRQAFDCECYGIDPSSKAIQDGGDRFPHLHLSEGTAETLPFEDDAFDTIIFGFCLYLCDRKDLFRIAFEADRCLRDGGTLVVIDFQPPFPYRNRYSHREGIYSYKMNYGKMFLWNPAYFEVANVIYSHSGYALRDVPDERIGVSILRKNEGGAYPESPFCK